jgi:peptide/nickel transport system permease protein
VTSLIIRRVGGMLLTLFIASMVIFFALQAAPGDPVTNIIGDPEKVTPERIAAVRAEFGLDRPVLVQYFVWLGGVFGGDWGTSFHYAQPVSTLVGSRLPVTLGLVLFAAIIFIVVGVLLGLAAALRRGRRTDAAVTATTTLLSSLPSFVIGLILVYVLGVNLRWFPVAGLGEGFFSQVWHLTLPAISLALGALAVIARVTRQSSIEQLDADHVEAARGYGLARPAVIRRHVLRNAWGPIITMAAIVVASLLAGTVVIESVFGLSGIGTLLVNGINTQDFPVVQAVLMFMVVAYMVTTTVVDLLQNLLDPRLRVRRTA